MIIFCSQYVYNFDKMKAVHAKMSILLAGVLNGVNFFPSTNNRFSATLGSLKAKFEIADGDGFSADAAKLKGDWDIVKSDINNSFNDEISNVRSEKKWYFSTISGNNITPTGFCQYN